MQREAVVAVLDVGLTGHGVEVGLQRELLEVLAGLHLQELRGKMSNVIYNIWFYCHPLFYTELLNLYNPTWKPLRSV